MSIAQRNVGSERCPYHLSGETSAEYFTCDQPDGHEGEHICYCENGTSFDSDQPEPETHNVRWSIHWLDHIKGESFHDEKR